MLEPVTQALARALCAMPSQVRAACVRSKKKRCGHSPQREKLHSKTKAELVAGVDRHGVTGVRKVILLAEPAVDPAGNNGGRRTLHAARVPTQEYCKRDLRVRVVRVGDEPADFRRCRVVVASP